MKIYFKKEMSMVLEDFAKKGIYPLQSGKYDDDWHVYLDTEEKYGLIWELGNQGRIRAPLNQYPAQPH